MVLDCWVFTWRVLLLLWNLWMWKHNSFTRNEVRKWKCSCRVYINYLSNFQGLVAFSEHGLMIRWWSLESVWWEKISRNLVPVHCTKLIFVPPWEGFSPNSTRSSIMASVASNEKLTYLQVFSFVNDFGFNGKCSEKLTHFFNNFLCRRIQGVWTKWIESNCWSITLIYLID